MSNKKPNKNSCKMKKDKLRTPKANKKNQQPKTKPSQNPEWEASNKKSLL